MFVCFYVIDIHACFYVLFLLNYLCILSDVCLVVISCVFSIYVYILYSELYTNGLFVAF